MNLTLYQTIIIVMFVLTGALNTISVKFADLEESQSIDGEIRRYNHPFLQSSQMFLGMFLNLVLYEILKYGFKKKSQKMYKEHILTKGSEDFNVFIFWIPALCDVLASTTVYIALNLTYASSFQMLKGAVIVFTSFLSYSCFGRVPNIQECLGIFLVVLGLAIVGLSDYLTKLGSSHKNDTLLILIGDLMVVTAQFLTATQVILEEKFVLALDVPPLQAVGWEGFFAFSTMAVLHVPLHFIYIGEPFVKNPSGTLEDLYDAYVQISNNWRILFASMVTVMSLAIYNFCGITVSKELTSTTREVLDSLNVIIVWIASLCLFGQKFQYIQLLGFMILLFGMGIYNDLCYTVIKKRSFQLEESESEDDEMTK